MKEGVGSLPHSMTIAVALTYRIVLGVELVKPVKRVSVLEKQKNSYRNTRKDVRQDPIYTSHITHGMNVQVIHV